ncbi:MAG: hypothetical protein MJA27_22180, partial [Pseudanabaenales cyanobacterium]|nr:hypothetical protein [Pseudanabaenales cyanobacterium]
MDSELAYGLTGLTVFLVGLLAFIQFRRGRGKLQAELISQKGELEQKSTQAKTLDQQVNELKQQNGKLEEALKLAKEVVDSLGRQVNDLTQEKESLSEELQQ